MKSVMSCLSFTAVMIQINHSVTDKHLGKVMRLSRFILHTSHFTLRTRSPSHKYCTLSSPPPLLYHELNPGERIRTIHRLPRPKLGTCPRRHPLVNEHSQKVCLFQLHRHIASTYGMSYIEPKAAVKP